MRAAIIALSLIVFSFGTSQARDRFERDSRDFMETRGERALTHQERDYRREKAEERQYRERRVPRYRDTPAAREPVYKRYERRFESKE